MKSPEPKIFQLQLWNAKTKAYESTGNTADSAKSIEALADTARLVSKAWRIAKVERSLKNPKHTPRGSSGSDRKIEDVQRDYLVWAQAKGLASIVAYSTKPPLNHAADRIVGYHRKFADKSVPIYTGQITYIVPDEQFAVEETTDLEQAA